MDIDELVDMLKDAKEIELESVDILMDTIELVG
jgi:hypothetical protein